MSPVVILSAPRDAHARAVEWVLRNRGINCVVQLGTDFPRLTSASIRLKENHNPTVMMELPEDNGDFSGGIGSLWRRRVGAPILRDDIHPSDVAAAEKELTAYSDGLGHVLDAISHFQANSYAGSLNARSKLNQLMHARMCGMVVPETLVTNCPADVRSFAQEHGGAILIKSFFSPTWAAENSAWCSYATRVPQSLLRNDESIAACPSIYQNLVKKKHEVRLFIAGRTCFAVKLDSQSTALGEVDWRAATSAKIPVEPIEVDDRVKDACFELMNRLNIVTGSFDFAVTEDDDYVFFEVNEQGQFLWMEQRCPQLPILDAFSCFLEAQDAEFEWSGCSVRQPSSFAAFVASGWWEQSCNKEGELHAPIGKSALYTEIEA